MGGLKEEEDVSYFDIPTVPFWLMNFHFRGQSMSVTATLVLWPKTAYCRQHQCICEIFHFASEPAEKLLC